MSRLTIIGPDGRQEVELLAHNTLGRHPNNTVQVLDRIVSKEHCHVDLIDGGRFILRDLGSLNGTYVGEEQIREADLYPNTEFTVGPLTFRVRYDYVGRIASAPGSIAAGDPPAPSAVEPGPDLSNFSETERQTPESRADFVQMQQKPAEPREEIAVPDDELPDFAAWDAAEKALSAGPSPEQAAPHPERRPGAETETERPNTAQEESAPARPPNRTTDRDQPAGSDDGFDEFLEGLK
jgi:predicted component of type VI protein secretion system